MNFSKIKGQDEAINTLKEFLKSGRIPQALIFHGVEGIGKATTALAFASALNCTNLDENKNACGVCPNCKQIEGNIFPDVIFADFAYQASILNPDEKDPEKLAEEVEKQQTIRIKTIRSLTSASQLKASVGKWKVYIIDNAQKLETEAGNALLKFIEEPPKNTLWILISSKKEVMLSTIKSRCQSIAFAPLKEDILTNILIDNFIAPDIAKKVAPFADGSTAMALKFAHLFEEFASFPTNSAFATSVAFSLPSVLAQARKKANAILDLLSLCAYNKWKTETKTEIKEQLVSFINKIVFYKRAISRNTSPQMVINTALVAGDKAQVKLQEIL